MPILFQLFQIRVVLLNITLIKNSSKASLQNDICCKKHGMLILLACVQCLTTWIWTRGTLVKATTSTIFRTHAYLLLALRPLNMMKTIRLLTQPHVDHFRLNFGKQCTMSLRHSHMNSTAGNMFRELRKWMSYQALRLRRLRLNTTPMDELKSSKLDFVQEATGKRKELIILRLGLLWCNGWQWELLWSWP